MEENNCNEIEQEESGKLNRPELLELAKSYEVKQFNKERIIMVSVISFWTFVIGVIAGVSFTLIYLNKF